MLFSSRRTFFLRHTLPHSQSFHHLCKSTVSVLPPSSTYLCTTNGCTLTLAATHTIRLALRLSVLASSAVIGKHTLSADPAHTRTAFTTNSCLGQPFRRTLSAVPMARPSSRSTHSSAACRAYVGEATAAAGEYHCNDFEWEDLRQEAEALLSARKAHQQDGRGAAIASQPSDPDYSLKLASKHVDSDLPQQQQQQQQNERSIHPEYDKGCWEAFHARDNATARFYKERRYLLLEFPCLTISQPPQHFVEIGCGCGSSLLPVLKANPTCTVTGTDLSPTAVDMFKRAAAKAGIATHRFTGYAADSTQADAVGAAKPDLHGSADAALLIFTLAAVTPEEMPAMLHTAFQALRPGGVLLIRDHGLYDLTHLRLPPEQQLADKLYRRLDGTTCYFFTTEDLRTKAENAGFVTRECKYACTNLLNRKKQINMKRVFVHGVFERPYAAASDRENA